MLFQVLTLSLAEQTNRLMRRVEDQVVPDTVRARI
jgi:hypothetical protein